MLSILTLPTPAPLHLLSLPCRKPPPPFHSPLKKRKPPGTGRIFAHFEYLLSSNITFLLWETFPKHTLPMPLSPSHTERFFSESLTPWYSSYSILPVPLSHSSGQDPQGPLFLICSKPLDGPAALEEQEGSLDCSAWKSGREMSGDAVVACGGRAGCGGKEGGEKAAKELSVVWVVNVWVPVEVDLYHGKDSALLWRIIENKEDDPIPKNVIIPDSDPLHLCQFGFPLWLYLGPEPQWAVLLGRKTNSPGPQRFCPWGSCPSLPLLLPSFSRFPSPFHSLTHYPRCFLPDHFHGLSGCPRGLLILLALHKPHSDLLAFPASPLGFFGHSFPLLLWVSIPYFLLLGLNSVSFLFSRSLWLLCAVLFYFFLPLHSLSTRHLFSPSWAVG